MTALGLRIPPADVQEASPTPGVTWPRTHSSGRADDCVRASQMTAVWQFRAHTLAPRGGPTAPAQESSMTSENSYLPAFWST
jgi:hypothetical protein